MAIAEASTTVQAIVYPQVVGIFGVMISKANYNKLFNDKRLERRAEQLSGSLLRSASSSIHSLCENCAQQKAYYRFLRSGKVVEASLIEEMVRRSAVSCQNKAVLAIRDTRRCQIEILSLVTQKQKVTEVAFIQPLL